MKQCQSCKKPTAKGRLCKSCAAKKRWANPAFKNRCGQAIASALSRPDVRARRSVSITVAMHRPETNAKLHSPKSEAAKKNMKKAQNALRLRFLHAQLNSGKWAGKKNPSWNGGIGQDTYRGTFTNLVKSLVRERDGFLCRLCNKPEGRMHHPVHHIFYNKRDSDLAKLITLCEPCHKLVHKQKKIWPPILIAKIESHVNDLM